MPHNDTHTIMCGAVYVNIGNTVVGNDGRGRGRGRERASWQLGTLRWRFILNSNAAVVAAPACLPPYAIFAHPA